MATIQVTLQIVDSVQNDMLIALMSEIGYEGFEEKDHSLLAYIDRKEFSEDELKTIAASVDVPFSISLIESRNWNSEWEESFQPVSVLDDNTGRIHTYVRASFHPAHPQSVFDIVINPKMSFGTGHHATTYLMAKEMADLKLVEKTVIDFGSGTGVLAILAEKMGASKVTAVDYDDWSIENSVENIRVNACSRIDVVKADCFPNGLTFDIILANINLNVIVENLPAMARSCKNGSTLLLSGMLIKDENQLVSILNENKIEVLKVYSREDWILVKATMTL